ncbi:MAG: hydrogenase maturation nickel metallochaperone HypA [Bacillota bacterium]
MHELSIVASIIDSISADARERGIKKISHIRIVVGEFSSVNTGALTFALSHVTRGTILADAAVEVTVREAREKCEHCNREFKPQLPFFQCPTCGKTAFSSSESRQIYIDFYEGE